MAVVIIPLRAKSRVGIGFFLVKMEEVVTDVWSSEDDHIDTTVLSKSIQIIACEQIADQTPAAPETPNIIRYATVSTQKLRGLAHTQASSCHQQSPPFIIELF